MFEYLFPRREYQIPTPRQTLWKWTVRLVSASKPRIRRDGGKWVCVGRGRRGEGDSALGAYYEWAAMDAAYKWEAF